MQAKQAGGAATAADPEADAAGAGVAVFLVRHGQRIDETPAGVAWRRQTDRWFDPPLTDEGREQAASAAAQLGCFMAAHAAEYAPFARVYASPLLRTLHTAEQFGIALSLPVAPVPGLATCTAAFKRHGPDANPLLREQRAREECPGAAMEPFDAAYEVPPRDADGGGGDGGGGGGGGDGAEHDPFVAAVVALAQREAAARSAAGGGGAAQKAAVLIVAHREGLRDLSQRTAAPFVKTKYCCVGVFGCTLAGGGGAAAVARGAGGGATFSLVHAPEQFEALAEDLLGGAGGGAAEVVVDAFAEGEETTQQAPRRIAHDGGRYTRAQFVRYYGGTTEWDAASDAPVVVDDRADSAKLSNRCEVM